MESITKIAAQKSGRLSFYGLPAIADGCTNVGGCEWLQLALPEIREAKTIEAAQRTAAHICAKIAANIAVGRNVKHFPRFYLSKNLK